MSERPGSNSERLDLLSGPQTAPADASRDVELESLRLQVMQLRDELIGSEAKLGELRERVQRLEARCQRTEDLCALRVAHVENELALGEMYRTQVELMLESTTWRVGRTLVAPSFAVKRALRGS